MMPSKLIRVDKTCFEAIVDIKKEYETRMKRMDADISITMTKASKILGKNYFKLKKSKKPLIVWSMDPDI